MDRGLLRDRGQCRTAGDEASDGYRLEQVVRYRGRSRPPAPDENRRWSAFEVVGARDDRRMPQQLLDAECGDDDLVDHRRQRAHQVGRRRPGTLDGHRCKQPSRSRFVLVSTGHIAAHQILLW
jgi:hypothetical protein